tara:strand:- start:2663 stop:2857 length:195 start_codon:yes stop_codon:yes gene_type:complete
MFKTKAQRMAVAFFLGVLFTFTCFWSITDDAGEAFKGLLVLYFAMGAYATSAVLLNEWINKGEE